jgi:thioredoxin 1
MITDPSTISNHRKVILNIGNLQRCNPCRTIAPVYEELEKQYSDITFFKMDSDEYQDMCDQLNITSIPTFISIYNGKEVARFSGCNKGKLEKLLNDLQKL